jgi:hypothetical protein
MLHKNRYLENLVARRDFYSFDVPRMRPLAKALAVAGVMTFSFFTLLGDFNNQQEQFNSQVRDYRAKNNIAVEKWMPPMWRATSQQLEDTRL